LNKGRVVPFFGAAASAIYRPSNEPWQPGKPFMPFGGELAETLAKAANYPVARETYNALVGELKRAFEGLVWQSNDDRQQVMAILSQAAEEEESNAQKAKSGLIALLRNIVGGAPDLAFIASWAEHVQGNRDYVNDNLHRSFAVECEPGDLHKTIAGVEATRLFITTNYDDLLEKALAPRHPHLIVDHGSEGLWVTPAGRHAQRVPSTGDRIYELLDDESTGRPSQPVIFKMHGSVDKSDPDKDCYIITEEDYVDFLGRDSGYYIPPYVSALMKGRDFLFLGYSLADWNVRVILRKLLRQPTRPVKCWAVVSGKSLVEQQVWQAHNLNIYPMDLLAFAKELKASL
jgi:hypothetical protein